MCCTEVLPSKRPCGHATPRDPALPSKVKPLLARTVFDSCLTRVTALWYRLLWGCWRLICFALRDSEGKAPNSIELLHLRITDSEALFPLWLWAAQYGQPIGVCCTAILLYKHPCGYAVPQGPALPSNVKPPLAWTGFDSGLTHVAGLWYRGSLGSCWPLIFFGRGFPKVALSRTRTG